MTRKEEYEDVMHFINTQQHNKGYRIKMHVTYLKDPEQVYTSVYFIFRTTQLHRSRKLILFS
jgi:hypothetical protein